MSYGTRPTLQHDAAHREPAQQGHRAQASYDHRQAADTPHHHESASNSWNSQSSFAPPKLPPPRHMSNQHAHLSYRDDAAMWTAKTDSHAPSVREDYSRQRPFHGGVSVLAPDSASRSRLHPLSDEPSSPYQQSPSVYARPSELATSRNRNRSFEHDQGRFASAPTSAYPVAPSPRVAPGRTGSVSHSLAPSLPPHSEPSHGNHFQRRATLHEFEHNRCMSMQPAQPAAHDYGNQSRYDSATPSASSWQSTHPAAKRPLPSDHEADTYRSSPVFPPRSYPSSSSQLRHDASLRGNASIPPSSSVVNVHDHEREGTIKPAPSKLTPASDTADASRDALEFTSGHASVLPQAAGTPILSQRPLQPQRKRLRISRACDECRRRKTRCDIVGAFPGEPGHPLTISGAVPPLEPNMEPKGEMLILQPCLNCRRSEVTCSYSKRPLKRGPSKGYIKDLERRLKSLESQLVAGDKADGDEQEHTHRTSGSADSTSADSAPPAAKPKIRTEDRISRLENVLARPSTAKSEKSDSDKNASSKSSRRSSEVDAAPVKSEDPSGIQDDDNLATKGADVPLSALPAVPDYTTLSKPSSEATDASDARSGARLSKKHKSNGKRRSAASPSSGPSDADVADVKNKVVNSLLHATFPIVPTRSEAESSSSNAHTIARIQDRVLARGMRLLTEPVEMITMPQSSPTSTLTPHGSKAASHAARVASLIGQASAGLGGVRDELALQARPGTDQLRALRKLSHRLSCQEADLLMLCHLDHLRNGRNNNSALAAAVSKLGSGSNIQDDCETYRRRTLLFMLDRWHAVAFGTPHLLMGRFGMERHSFRSMKEALGDVSQSALGEGVYEVLRCAIMFGQLNDLVQNNGGWKGISNSDVEAVIHSATDEDERATAASEPSSSSSTSVADAGLLGTAAMRYSLESAVRCYYALHTLPDAKDATVEDVHRIFGMAERIIVLGGEKTPISLQGKLLQSAIGPHVLCIAGVAFSWCLRMICMLVAQTLSAISDPNAAHFSDLPEDAATVTVTATSFPLELLRRKMLDYVRMCGPFCLFSGGSPTSPASFAPVYLRLALYFNQTVSFASSLGSLVSPQSANHSPVHQDPTALGNEANNVLDMAKEMGFLGYLLASTHQSEARQLLTGAPAPST